MFQAKIHEIVSGNILSLKALINETINNRGKIDAIYVSIGGKCNEPLVSFNKPDKIKHKSFRTNSHYQLLPEFLEVTCSTNKNVLIIAFDDFSNQENRIFNRSMVEKRITENMTVILFDKIVDKSFLESFIELFLSVCMKNNIYKNNAYICNFIKHLNEPSTLDYKSEEMVPQHVQNLLDNTDYSECFYQWFGYHYFTYNLVYRYKNHLIYHLKNFPLIFESHLERQNTNNMLSDKNFINFLMDIHDITSIDGEIQL